MIEQTDLVGSFRLPDTSLTAKRMGYRAPTKIVTDIVRHALRHWREVRTNA